MSSSSNIVFAIFIPGRKENVGGHVVLHKLLKILCDIGEEVWTNEVPMFECNANIIRHKIDYDLSFADGKKLVAIYPEQVEGNPFRAKHVARWILYHTKNNVEDTWDISDEYFFHVRGFFTKRKIKSKRMLSIIDSKPNIFYNHGLGNNRTGYCHINKKKYPKDERILSDIGSKDLSDFMLHGGFSYLAEQFNKHEYFLTYDDATFYSIAAAMCGCRSIILNPDPSTTPAQWRENYHMSKYGIAYGWNDLKHADMTKDLVRDLMKSTEKTSVTLTSEFVNFWKSKLG